METNCNTQKITTSNRLKNVSHWFKIVGCLFLDSQFVLMNKIGIYMQYIVNIVVPLCLCQSLCETLSATITQIVNYFR